MLSLVNIDLDFEHDGIPAWEYPLSDIYNHQNVSIIDADDLMRVENNELGVSKEAKSGNNCEITRVPCYFLDIW